QRTADRRIYFRRQDQGMRAPRMRESYQQELGPKAKPATREAVLESSARMDLKAFAPLRASMAAFDGVTAARAYPGPRVAIVAEGNENPVSAGQLPGARRVVIPNVS